MTNKHIKTINGRQYYYSSIRKGKKVTSRYLGPVQGKQQGPFTDVQHLLQKFSQPLAVQEQPSDQQPEPRSEEDDFYIA